MASPDFQESLKNYLDLEQLRKKLEAWPDDLDAFEDIIRRRSAHYEPLLPAIDREFSRLDDEMQLRLEQRERIEQQLNAMVSAPRPDLLLTADERSMSEQLERLEKLVTPQSDEADPGYVSGSGGFGECSCGTLRANTTSVLPPPESSLPN